MAAKPWIVKPLLLPVADKTYSVGPVSYDDGLTLITISDGGKTSKINAKTPEAVLFELVLGETWAEMRADGQPYPVLHRAGLAALEYQLALVMGLDSEDAVTLGEAIWESGLSPEAVAAQVAASQTPETPAPSTASTRSTSTASARKTRSQASTRTTTSRQATPRTPAKKAAPRSPGTR